MDNVKSAPEVSVSNLPELKATPRSKWANAETKLGRAATPLAYAKVGLLHGSAADKATCARWIEVFELLSPSQQTYVNESR